MTHYETLGVNKDATLKEIKAAYKALAMANHPDRVQGREEQMAAINAAYGVLSDPAQRKEYDETGGVDVGRADRMRDALNRLLLQTLSDLENVNNEAQLFDAMWQHMQTERQHGADRAAQLTKYIPKRKRIAERITRKNGKPNLFSIILMNNVTQCEKELATILKAITDIDEMCETIREYELKGDSMMEGFEVLGAQYFTPLNWLGKL